MNAALLGIVTLIYAAVSAYGLYLIKDASTLLSLRAGIGAVLYGGGFCIWIAMLRLFPLSIAFPVAAGSLIIATNLIARFLLGEAVLTSQTIGIALILGGIVLVSVKVQ
jgi:multidrug transporter EmrE-like cation transporter